MESTKEKPTVKGPINGNIFAVMGACTRVLQRAGQAEEATKLTEEVMNAESYNQALVICAKYVNFNL